MRQLNVLFKAADDRDEIGTISGLTLSKVSSCLEIAVESLYEMRLLIFELFYSQVTLFHLSFISMETFLKVAIFQIRQLSNIVDSRCRTKIDCLILQEVMQALLIFNLHDDFNFTSCYLMKRF